MYNFKDYFHEHTDTKNILNHTGKYDDFEIDFLWKIDWETNGKEEHWLRTI